MSLILSGTDGLSDIDGSAATPAIRGTDANTGIFFPAADTIAFSKGGAEAMRIDSDGDVGIGTASPVSRLDVFKSTGPLQYVRDSTVNSYWSTDTTLSFFGTETAHPQTFRTSGTERMRIDSSGNLLVGTTSANAKLTVNGADNSSSANSFVARKSDSTILIQARNDGFVFLPTTYNNTTSGAANVFINTDGSMYRSTASSQRFKENIADWTDSGLSIINKLKPKTFTYKANYYKFPDKKVLGLIAEEVETESSYLVDFENEDGTGQVENVRYATIVVPLIKAIQEQQALIQSLTDRITALESK